MENNKNEYEDENDIKIIFLGEPGYGKTSIINAYIDIEFNPNEKATISSSAIDIKYTKNNKSFNIYLWENCGSEK